MATAKNITLDLQNTNTRDAIQIVAKLTHINVVISPSVTGLVSLHLQNMPAEQALNAILNSNGLMHWETNHTWFVVPQMEFMQRKQDELKSNEILNETAPLITRVRQIYYAKAEDIGHLLQDNTNSLLSKRGHVRVDVRTNTICIQDIPERIADIQRLIKRLDIQTQQVLIETRLVSIDSDFERELGVNFSVQKTNNEYEESKAADYALAFARLVDGSLLDVKLAALENEGHGELISSPRLFTGNQESASIESGEEIPYQEVSRSGATGVAFKKAVLSLKVIPQVMPNNRILLQLQVNQDKPSNRIVLGVPAINTRQMSTHILVKNGQTIVLGGIYELNKENAQQRIPFLGKIPVIGWLFQQLNNIENKRELLIFVTPKIIS
jgi:type IV pilus assembly protein PilQ